LPNPKPFIPFCDVALLQTSSAELLFQPQSIFFALFPLHKPFWLQDVQLPLIGALTPIVSFLHSQSFSFDFLKAPRQELRVLLLLRVWTFWVPLVLDLSNTIVFIFHSQIQQAPPLPWQAPQLLWRAPVLFQLFSLLKLLVLLSLIQFFFQLFFKEQVQAAFFVLLRFNL